MMNQDKLQKESSTLTLASAVAISEAESIHVNLQYDLAALKSSTNTPVTLVLPNYNNVATIEAALDSILGQRGCEFKLVVLDNHSTDGSWEIILDYQVKHSCIFAERLPFNTGPFTWGETVFRSPVAGYVMPCSGNDVLASDTVVASFASYLDSCPGVCLVYGQSDEMAKPNEYTFSVPELGRQSIYEGLDAPACHDLVTWLYNYSESLWGMYRTDQLKLISIPSSYGSDHVLVSALGCLGGISGVRQVTRRVSSNAGRGLDGLRNSQVKRRFSSDATVLTPLEHTNFLMLSYSYFQGLRDSHLPSIDKDQLVARSISILWQRFQSRIKEEAIIYSNMLPKLRALARSRSDQQLLHRIETEDSFVNLYLADIFLAILS